MLNTDDSGEDYPSELYHNFRVDVLGGNSIDTLDTGIIFGTFLDHCRAIFFGLAAWRF